MSYRPYPPDLWRFWTETRLDVDAANEAVQQGLALSVRLWSAWLWQQSGIPTALLAVEGKKRTYLVTALVGLRDTAAQYEHLDVLCAPTGRWAQKLGAEPMRELIAYLEPEPRQRAWNAFCGTNGADAPNVPQLRSRLEHLPRQMTLEPRPAAVPATKRAEVASDLASMAQFFGEKPSG